MRSSGFTLEITDTYVDEGHAYFIGILRGDPNLIHDRECTLVIDDVAVARFTIDGEALDLVKPPSRALITRAPLDRSLVQRAVGGTLREIP